jgi:hypothetical protein
LRLKSHIWPLLRKEISVRHITNCFQKRKAVQNLKEREKTNGLRSINLHTVSRIRNNKQAI